MNIDNLHDALNYLDDDMIETVYKLRKERQQYQKKTQKVWMRWGTVAACFCLLVIGIYVAAEMGFLQLGGPMKDSVKHEMSDGTTNDMELPEAENDMNSADDAPDGSVWDDNSSSEHEEAVFKCVVEIQKWYSNGFEGKVTQNDEEGRLKEGDKVFVVCDDFVPDFTEFSEGSTVTVTAEISVGQSDTGEVMLHAVDLDIVSQNNKEE